MTAVYFASPASPRHSPSASHSDILRKAASWHKRQHAHMTAQVMGISKVSGTSASPSKWGMGLNTNNTMAAMAGAGSG